VKGVILLCIKDMVVNKHGKNAWENILEAADLLKNMQISAYQDIEDDTVMEIIDSSCRLLKLSPEEIADAFGEHWISTYTQKFYRRFFEGIDNSMDFILSLDDVHRKSTVTIPNAKPPRFEYEQVDDYTLVMTYKSSRGLWNFFYGLLKAVGKYYDEELEFTRIGDNKIEIKFPPKKGD